jgi:hypothetical protein
MDDKGGLGIEEYFLSEPCQKMFSAWSRRARLFLCGLEFP